MADQLGDLALAIEQAATYCEQTHLPLTVMEEWLTHQLEQTISLGAVANRPEVTVATLWSLSVDRLFATEPAAVALLNLLALCAPDPLPLNLFRRNAHLLGDGPLAGVADDDRLGTDTR